MTQSVVSLKEIEPEIVQVTMHDRNHKNTFTEELMLGLIDSFESIRGNSNYKAVILTGYDNYFSSGGTKEMLLSIYQGKMNFPDAVKNIYRLALDCKIPVISAMQGHSIGGGFSFGLFADFVILSRESIYTTNYMKYGFTPGMGTTYILPKKLGYSLAQELLLNGSSYLGVDLEKRGIPFPVIPRAAVVGHAIELARQLAEKPRLALITLKDHLVEPIRKKLSKSIEQEILMQKETFHQKEVKKRIMETFGN
jgi:polyketide biosynthesis enoyl-CoA hydratase PksI